MELRARIFFMVSFKIPGAFSDSLRSIQPKPILVEFKTVLADTLWSNPGDIAITFLKSFSESSGTGILQLNFVRIDCPPWGS